jgi:hypothetical protein
MSGMKTDPKQQSLPPAASFRAHPHGVLVLLSVEDCEDGTRRVRLQGAPHVTASLPAGDEYPRCIGVVDGTEFWSDDASKIRQLPPMLASQPYAAVTETEVLLWSRGWPPDLCIPQDKPSMRVRLVDLLHGRVAIVIPWHACVPSAGKRPHVV